ncbi:MAG: nucleotide sugar dehydrogenase [Candidatus Hydrogenedentes bacterium]|nr:nucleotide sugar dehydrogenase [Candidatus Hydrogenedentota bacterium]
MRRKIDNRTAVSAVIGLGYVGLPVVRHLCNAGFRVVGFDIDEKKVMQLKQGKSYIGHIPEGWIASTVTEGIFRPTADYSVLRETDCISICVPTPLNKNREPNLTYIVDTCKQIGRYLRHGQLVILESTTYPGTTEELVLPALSRQGLRVGHDYFLAFSPEREDPGNARFTIDTIPKVIGGVTERCTEVAARYYATIFERIVPVSTPAVAEMSKLLENIFRSVNIALVNELKVLCTRMGIDVWEVIHAASTKPFGFMPFYPGPGLGGHCIPVDPFYLTWKAREYGVTTRFVELSGEINASMPRYVVERTMEALSRQGKPLCGARVLVLGAAYKKNIDDVRESPALELIQLLQEQGAIVKYNDPYVPRITPGRNHTLTMESVPLTAELLRESDCVLVATAHECYDAHFIAAHAPLIVDTRNMMAGVKNCNGKVVKA